MLRKLFGMEEQKQEEKRDEEISLNYLLALESAIGAKKAIEIIQKYGQDDLIDGENLLELFLEQIKSKHFTATPDSIILYALNMLELDNKVEDLKLRAEKASSVADTLEEFLEFHKQLIDKDKTVDEEFKEELLSYNPFYRDVLTQVPRKLVEVYGEIVFEKDKDVEGYTIQVGENNQKKLKGITRKQIFDFLIELQSQGKEVRKSQIIKGFDDIYAAMEASVTSNAQWYLALGFTSLEEVRSVTTEDILILDDRFRFSEQGGQIELFAQLVGKYVNGNKQRMEEMLELGEHPGAARYLRALGDVDQLKKIMNMEKKPSASSIFYVKRNFGLTEYDEVIETAMKIDCDNPCFFERDCESIDEFFEFKRDYERVNEKFKALRDKDDDDDDISIHKYEKLVALEKDDAFDRGYLKHFHMHELERIKDMSKLMGSANYDELKIPKQWKEDLVKKLVKVGYSVQSIIDVFTEKISNETAKQLISNVRENKYKLSNLVEIARSGQLLLGFALLESGLDLKQQGVPYSILPAFKANEFGHEQVVNFAQTVGFDRYKTDDGFDAMELIRDMRIFYNKEIKIKELDQQGNYMKE